MTCHPGSCPTTATLRSFRQQLRVATAHPERTSAWDRAGKLRARLDGHLCIEQQLKAEGIDLSQDLDVIATTLNQAGA